MKTLLAAITNPRDYFLVHLLFETGLRLRHEDIQSWNNEIIIQPGCDAKSLQLSQQREYLCYQINLRMKHNLTFLNIC